ncbi:hypothetical protein ACLKA7_001220 [Drosophila subpalustris]
MFPMTVLHEGTNLSGWSVIGFSREKMRNGDGPAPFDFGDDGCASEWKNWLRGFDMYAKAMKITKGIEKLNWMLHYAGPKIQAVFSSLPEDEEERKTQDGRRSATIQRKNTALQQKLHATVSETTVSARYRQNSQPHSRVKLQYSLQQHNLSTHTASYSGTSLWFVVLRIDENNDTSFRKHRGEFKTKNHHSTHTCWSSKTSRARNKLLVATQKCSAIGRNFGIPSKMSHSS